MKKSIYGICLFLMLFTAGTVFAQRKIIIKVASPVPENTPWGQCLKKVAEEWRKITNNEVDMVIYHNGVTGSEKDVVRSLKINQIQAAVLSTFGLYEITPEIMTLSCPFLIRNDDELDVVLSGLKDELEQKINSKGYFTLAWSRVGWVKLFSKAPVFVPDDLKKQKLGTNAEQSELNQVFKSMGFQMIPVARNDILIALNSGMADAVYESPIAVGSSQVFGLAKNMASINIAPFMGGIILNERAWRSIPEKYRSELIAVTRRIEAQLDRDVRSLEDDMINKMGNYGLKVNQLSRQQEQIWYDDIGKVMPSLVGTAFDRGIFNRITAILQEFRSRKQ